MRAWCTLTCVLVAVSLHISSAQLPPRPLSIPGAVLIPGARPSPLRKINPDFAGPRPRRPVPNAIPVPIREVRPVIEEEEESASPSSSFDSDVNKLGFSALNAAVRQAEEEGEPTVRPTPLAFRPEKSVPITRDQIRERPSDGPPRPLPAPRPLPVLRQEPRPLPSAAPRPVIRQERPTRQEIDDDEDLPLRQPARKARPQPPPQQFRPAPVPRAAPRPQLDEDDGNRRRKPPVQILRKYRTDNEDGSITWGFENEDGTFKEETLGTDCITKGKYGYVDPDGVRREYAYESGNKCDQQPDEEPEEEILSKIQPKKPLNVGKSQSQFRPPGGQF